MEDPGVSWEKWIGEAIERLESVQHVMSVRPLCPVPRDQSRQSSNDITVETYEPFNGLGPWDRSAVEVDISEETFRRWLNYDSSCGEEIVSKCLGEEEEEDDRRERPRTRKLILFSSNNYLGLCNHPTVVNAASNAVRMHGMGPRSAPLICGYTYYHRLLESRLADLKKKKECLLCPTGCAANMAVMTAIGSLGSVLLPTNNIAKPSTRDDDQKIAIFSDSLNHASIIDGIRVAGKIGNVQLYVYKHCDMFHLNSLLSKCTSKKKVVVTDSLFSMDGDFAPIKELVKLRKKHGFLLVVDDAHGTFIMGKNGGGIAEEFNCEDEVDICVGTLSKAAGCLGGFVACSKLWKLFIQSRGRAFVYSTALPVPVVAAAHAAVEVARKEGWRRKAIWERVKEFRALTGLPVQSPIISLVVGTEDNVLRANRTLLNSGFHVVAIGPPVVPPKSCRLRVSLAAAHTSEDVKKLVDALKSCLNFDDINNHAGPTFQANL